MANLQIPRYVSEINYTLLHQLTMSWVVDGLISSEDKGFCLCQKPSRLALGHHPASSNEYQGSSQGRAVKQPRYSMHHPPPPSTKVWRE